MHRGYQYKGIQCSLTSSSSVDNNIRYFVERYAENLAKNGIVEIAYGLRINKSVTNKCIFSPSDAGYSQYLTPFSEIKLEYEYTDKCRNRWGAGLHNSASGINIIITDSNKKNACRVAQYCPALCIISFPGINFALASFEDYMLNDVFDLIFDSLATLRNLQSLDFPRLVENNGDKPSLRMKLGDYIVKMDITEVSNVKAFEDEIKGNLEKSFGEHVSAITQNQIVVAENLKAHYDKLIDEASGITPEFADDVFKMHGYITKENDYILVSIPSGVIKVDTVCASGYTYRIPEQLQKTFCGYFIFAYHISRKNKVYDVWFLKNPFNGELQEDFDTFHSYGREICLGESGGSRIIGREGIPGESVIDYLKTLLSMINWSDALVREPKPHEFWGDLTEWIVKCTTNLYDLNKKFFGLDLDHQICPTEKEDAPTYVNDDGKEVKDGW